MAEGTIYIIESNYDQVTAWFKSKKRQKLYTWDKSKFLQDVRAGEVWDADVTNSFVALGNHHANKRFFQVEADVLQKVNVSTYIIADNEEEAKEKLVKGVESGDITNFADLRRGGYIPDTTEESQD